MKTDSCEKWYESIMGVLRSNQSEVKNIDLKYTMTLIRKSKSVLKKQTQEVAVLNRMPIAVRLRSTLFYTQSGKAHR